MREEEVAANHPLGELMAMLSREVPCQRIRLTDLSHAEATELAGLVLEQHSSDQTTANVDGVLAKVLLDHTGGNPFFIQEIVRDLVDTGRWSAGKNTGSRLPRLQRGTFHAKCAMLSIGG